MSTLRDTINTELERLAYMHIWEFNDDVTRRSARKQIGHFLTYLKNDHSIKDFHVKCDTQNNPPTIVEKNMFIVDVYYQPTTSLNYIHVNVKIEPQSQFKKEESNENWVLRL